MQVDGPEQNPLYNTAPKPAPKPVGKTAATEPEKSAKETEAEQEPSVIDELREKGFMAYVEEVHKEKMEELRAKILDSMGLSEEQLGALPAEQRGLIEDMIAEKIKRIMMAKSDLSEDYTASPMGAVVKPLTSSSIQNGMDTGLALIQAMEASNANAPINGRVDTDDDR